MTDQLYRLASGQVTSVELVRQSLQIIDATQHTLHAFETVLADSALYWADQADQRRACGHDRPLLGIPVAISDNIDYAGVETRWGTGCAVSPAKTDDEIVSRLKAAGAIIVGKTTISELGQWPFSVATTQGITTNPWSATHSPGGSCGGAATAVAAGIVPVAIGVDSTGDIRVPASWTHVVALKPTQGLPCEVPVEKDMSGLASYGVISRNVGDAALTLDALCATQEPYSDRSQGTHTLVQALGNAPGQLRIAISTRLPYINQSASVDPQITEGLEMIAHHLRDLGHWVMWGNPDYGMRMFWDFVIRFYAGLVPIAERFDPYDQPLDARTRQNVRVGYGLSQALLRRARAHQKRTGRRVGSIFRLVDVVVMPTTAVPVRMLTDFHDKTRWETNRESVHDCPLTWPWNVVGWPAMSIPAGFTAQGLPRGVQLVGAAGAEPILVSLGAALEGLCGWMAHQPRPWWNTKYY